MYGKRRSVYVILITYNKNSCYSKKNGDKKYLHDIFLLLFFSQNMLPSFSYEKKKNARLCIEIVEVVI